MVVKKLLFVSACGHGGISAEVRKHRGRNRIELNFDYRPADHRYCGEHKLVERGWHLAPDASGQLTREYPSPGQFHGAIAIEENGQVHDIKAGFSEPGKLSGFDSLSAGEIKTYRESLLRIIRTSRSPDDSSIVVNALESYFRHPVELSKLRRLSPGSPLKKLL